LQLHLPAKVEEEATMSQTSGLFSFLNRKEAKRFLGVMLRELRTVSLRHGFPGVLKAINQALLELKKSDGHETSPETPPATEKAEVVKN
jgi:hypothetical protein